MNAKSCVRCGVSFEKEAYSMSYFNTDECCLECLEQEKKHPMYQKAKEIERQEVAKGNYNFEGIGLPEDFDYPLKNKN